MVALAHLVHGQSGVEGGAFEPGEDLDGRCLMTRLGLQPPAGVYDLARCLAADAPLRAKSFIRTEGDFSRRRGGGPSVSQFLRTDLSLGLDGLGKVLGVAPEAPQEKGPALEDLLLCEEVRTVAARLAACPPDLDQPFLIFLKGAPSSGREALARALAARLGRPLRPTRAHEGPQPGQMVLFEQTPCTDEDDWDRIKEHPGWMFIRQLGPVEQIDLEPRADLVLDLAAPSEADLRAFIEARLAALELTGCDAAALAATGAAPGRIVDALAGAARRAAWGGGAADTRQARLLKVLSTQAEGGDPAAVEVAKATRTLDELCLGAEAQERFTRIVRTVRGRAGLLAKWNLDPGLVGRAQGILLFHGPSGTGKSMAAEVLAHELDLPLWRMEATELESPFVGESEERLHKFFAAAKGKPAVLLLDEADTVLMDRGRTEGSTRRYQNSLVNTWLRELDRFEGILVLTTNHAQGLDPAVERRIQFRLAFAAPDAPVRQRIWESLFRQGDIPGREGLDLAAVAARFPLAGGRIRNAFLDACHRAAEAGAIDQSLLLAACEEESRSALPTEGAGRRIGGFGRS